MAELLESGARSDEPGELRPGARLGRYELLVPIARGGMARVWAARLHGQRGFQKLVAIKTILPHLVHEVEFERMFLDEARIASLVHHPNVCEIYELGEERGTLYLAMEWISGDSLARVLRGASPEDREEDEPIDPRVAARVLADACGGIHAAHDLTDEDGRALGVVHRDVSPHNLLLTTDGFVKVCDFGVAKALGGQLHEQTSVGQLKGKLAYMSPEQLKNAPLDRRSDVFSLGSVLYEATTGVRAFRGTADPQVMVAIMNAKMDPPTSVLRGYPADLEKIVLRALAHEPSARYPSAERMRFALEEYLAKGQLVTASDVAEVLKARIGDVLERRKERLRQVQSAADQVGWEPPPSHDSGVKASVPNRPRRRSSRPPPVPPPPPSPSPQPSSPSSPTIPEAPVAIMDARPDLAVPRPSARARPSDIPLPIAHLDDERAEGVGDHEARTADLGSARATSRRSEPSTKHLVLAMAGGLAAAVAIGGLVLGGWHLGKSDDAAGIAPAPGSALVAPPPTSTPASARIVVRTAPPEATLLVDGVDLPRDRRVLPRPPAGRTVTLVAHAKGYEDMSVLVDYFTATPLDIPMKPLLEFDGPGPAKPHPKRPPRDGTREGAKDGKDSKEPNLPSNPY